MPIKNNINNQAQRSLLLIYTGGTLAMQPDANRRLVPMDGKAFWALLQERMPEALAGVCFEAMDTPLDSAEITPLHWQGLARLIGSQADSYAGFVVLHGSDTMAYTASALSFMLEGLAKPIVLTGAQIPLPAARSDAEANLSGALEIASAVGKDGRPLLQEVAIFFAGLLLRGNRTSKYSAQQLAAYRSPNYPPLASMDRQLCFRQEALLRPHKKPPRAFETALDTHIATLSFQPSMSEACLRPLLEAPALRGLVLETYGAGNAPPLRWLFECLHERIQTDGLIVLLISGCPNGYLQLNKYGSSAPLHRLKALNGHDLSLEAATTKLICALGRYSNKEDIKRYMTQAVAGEFSPPP